jgi:hypothetical protein
VARWFRRGLSVADPFGCRCLTGVAMLPFPHPAHRTVRLQLRPPPSIGITRLHRYYEPPPSQSGRPFSRELTVDFVPQSPLGLPVLRMVHFACMPSPIPGRSDGTRSLVPFHSLRPSPKPGQVGSCVSRFRGLLSVYSRQGLHARRIAYATFYAEGFTGVVASAAASIATGWSEPVPGRVYPRCGPPPFHGAPGSCSYSSTYWQCCQYMGDRFAQSLNSCSVTISRDEVKPPSCDTGFFLGRAARRRSH